MTTMNLEILANSITIVFTLSGLFFFIAGFVGLVRFPDIFSRMHALAKADNIGLGLIIIGLLPQMSSLFQAIQALLIWGLVMISGTVSSYLISNSIKGNSNDFYNRG